MKKIDKVFWFGFVWFCAMTIFTFKIFNLVDLSKLGRVEDGILVGSLLPSGAAIRYWMSKNFDEKKFNFKIEIRKKSD